MIVVVAQKGALDLQHILSYPITTYPLSLAHCDGSLVKTDKSALLRYLESLQHEVTVDIPRNYVHILDGGLLLHSVLSQTHIGTSYGAIARTILSTICTGRSTEVHLCLDKYVPNSIKDSERKIRGAVDSQYIISGPEQKIRQSGQKLLQNGIFKNEFGKFLLREWKKDHYWHLLEGKILVASFGGECYQYVPDDSQTIEVSMPEHLQGDHEEADTLIAFHMANITARNITVRASDTDVLVILIGSIGRLRVEVRSMMSVYLDCGMGNNRRYINISMIVEHLEEKKLGLAKAIPGYHAFTGCDFTSAFYRYSF